MTPKKAIRKGENTMNENGMKNLFGEREILISDKIIKEVRKELYIKLKALAPALYRMPTVYIPFDTFGTDGHKMYMSPFALMALYKSAPEDVMHRYLHSVMHCVFLQPFLDAADKDETIWETAIDMCIENAISKMEPAFVSQEEKGILSELENAVKLPVPSAVYWAIKNGKISEDPKRLYELFHIDEHIWLQQKQSQQGQQGQQGQSKNGNGQGQGQSQSQNQSQNQNQKGKGNGQGQGQGQQSQDKNGNGQGQGQSQSQNQNQNGQGQSQNQSQSGNGNGNGSGKNQNQNQSQSQNQQNGGGDAGTSADDWKSVAKQISCDMKSFNKTAGDSAGCMESTIDYVTSDKTSYDEFLRSFSFIQEVMKLNMDEFDMMAYATGLEMDPDNNIAIIEPLEYKDEKRVREFVVCIDTSGSTSGEVVEAFLKKTYSVLKSTESFSSRVNIHIIQCDAKVQDDTKIENKEQLEKYMKNLKVKGHGGTDFRPAFNYVEELIKKGEFENIGGLIYFTDGYGSYPAEPTPYKTAFVFLEDYTFTDKNVPAWAMKAYWTLDDAEAAKAEEIPEDVHYSA